MLSRRQFLIGSGAAVAVGAGAWLEAGASRRDRILHRLGFVDSPDNMPPRADIRLVSGTMRSRHMPEPVKWTVSVPDAAEGAIYCLHGRGESHRFAFDVMRVQDFIADSHHALTVAAVDGGSDSYWHRRTDGRDPLAMLLDEFIPMIEADHGAPQKRALLGWSMGGYGALLAAETAPERFLAVAVASPALWTSPGATAPGAFDGPDDWKQYDVFARTSRLAGLTVRVDCGRGDPFFAADKAFVAKVPGAQSSFGTGFHDSKYWRSVAPTQIETIRAALGLPTLG